MKILSIAAGAAGMYCGSCLRDNALAAELLRRGHDVILLPLYTPLRTDEPSVAHRKVFFGGISIYLQQLSALFRWTPRMLDRLWDAPWALKLASRSSLPVSPKQLGELTVSMLEGAGGIHAREVDKLVAWLRHETPPDVVNLPNSLLIALAAPLKRALGRPVCCTLQGEDLFLEGLPEPYRIRALDLIRRHLPHVDAFLPVSRFYADFMAEYLEIPRERMRVVPLGVNAADFAAAPPPAGRPFTIGFLGRVAPEKGLHVLAGAFLHLAQRGAFPGVVKAAGYLPPESRGYLSDILKRVADAGLASRFQYVGEVDRAGKIEFFGSIDAFTLPCTYGEPKGLPVLEALAAGVPVVQPRVGAFPEMLERTGGGLLVDPGPANLAAGLEKLARDPAAARALGEVGAAGVRRHYTVAAMADAALEAWQVTLASKQAGGQSGTPSG